MIEFKALIEPPKWMIQKRKHRITFCLNEGNEEIIATAGVWAFKKKYLKVSAVGDKGLNFSIIAHCEKYKIEEDHGLLLIFDCYDADSIVAEVTKAHFRGEWIRVTVEETEKPNGVLETGNIRKSEWKTV